MKEALTALWAPDVGLPAGYTDVSDFTNWSLYDTAWSLRLAQELKLNDDWLDVGALIARLTPILTTKPSDFIVLGLSELQATILAADALYVIDPGFRVDDNLFDRFAIGGVYADSPGGGEDWDATALIVAFQMRHALPIDARLVPMVRERLEFVDWLRDFSMEDLAVLQVAAGVLTPVERLRLADRMSALLTRWVIELNDWPLSGVTPGVFVEIDSIFEAFGGQSRKLPFRGFESLRTSTGYYGLVEGDQFGDPQVTYNVGYLLDLNSEDVADRFRFGGLPWGWMFNQSPVAPTIESDYYAAVLGLACGVVVRLFDEGGHTLQGLAPSMSGDVVTAGSMSRYCWLMRIGGVAVDQATASVIRMTGPAQVDKEISRSEILARADVAAILDGCGVDLSSSLPNLSHDAPVKSPLVVDFRVWSTWRFVEVGRGRCR
ncbi:MAG: hypothetical protein FWD75_10205 [Propionibacteriaceae bacterium]|nr:hypothetical protein [Propionibacteriaceae bacterium]